MKLNLVSDYTIYNQIKTNEDLAFILWAAFDQCSLEPTMWEEAQ